MLRSVKNEMLSGEKDTSDIPKLVGYCRFEDILPLRECRKKRQIPDGAKTVIVCLFPYFTGEYAGRNVARYAVSNDYHELAGKRLGSLTAQLKAAFPDEEFVWFADDSPVREVAAAAKCGLGVTGGHGMLIHKNFGSWVNIGEIVTTLELVPANTVPVDTGCLNCESCVKACPTKAFKLNSPLDRKLCRSWLTQRKTAADEFGYEQIRQGGMVCGCDLCAEACPLNKDAAPTPFQDYYDSALPVVTRENLRMNISRKAYSHSGESVILRNLDIISDKERFCGNSKP